MDARQGDGGIPSVITGRGLGLLIGRILLFVHDDEREIPERQKEGGTGAEDHGRTRTAERFGDLAAPDGRPAGVEDLQAGPEFWLQEGLQLVAEGDFGAEDEYLLPLGHGLPDGGQAGFAPPFTEQHQR